MLRARGGIALLQINHLASKSIVKNPLELPLKTLKMKYVHILDIHLGDKKEFRLN